MNNPNEPKREVPPALVVDDLMIRDDDDTPRPSGMTAVRDIASKLPESLSSIGRDLSRTLERAISAKDDYVVAVKVSPAAQERLDQLVATGLFSSRAEAAAYLIDEGIKAQPVLFDRIADKQKEIDRLRAEMRGLLSTEA